MEIQAHKISHKYCDETDFVASQICTYCSQEDLRKGSTIFEVGSLQGIINKIHFCRRERERVFKFSSRRIVWKRSAQFWWSSKFYLQLNVSPRIRRLIIHDGNLMDFRLNADAWFLDGQTLRLERPILSDNCMIFSCSKRTSWRDSSMLSLNVSMHNVVLFVRLHDLLLKQHSRAWSHIPPDKAGHTKLTNRDENQSYSELKVILPMLRWIRFIQFLNDPLYNGIFALL